jgi:hypothetical protein
MGANFESGEAENRLIGARQIFGSTGEGFAAREALGIGGDLSILKILAAVILDSLEAIPESIVIGN